MKGAVVSGEMKTMALALAYNGEGFSGFAKQKDEGIRTVQGCLEQALKTVFRREIETICAGRTDAGVHALGQVVSFALTPDEAAGLTSRRLLISLNAITDDDITVKQAVWAPDDFSARFDAQWREYRYRICVGSIPPQFLSKVAWWHKSQLDVDAMKQAATYLIGENDFKSFCKKASSVDKTTMRCVRSIDLFEEEHLGEMCLVIKVIGNAFLHSMVRTIVGTLVEVGVGRKQPEWVGEVLAAKNRDAAGPNAPACGLTFWCVDYGDIAFEEMNAEG